jgi:hypothetical protein
MYSLRILRQAIQDIATYPKITPVWLAFTSTDWQKIPAHPMPKGFAEPQITAYV